MMEGISTNLALFSEALGWTIVHTVWQFALVAIVARLLLYSLPNSAASWRYALSVVALFVMSLWSLVSFGQQWQKLVTESQIQAFSKINTTIPTVETTMNSAVQTQFWEEFLSQISNYLPFVSLFWMLGIGLLASRMLYAYWELNRLTNHQIQPPPNAWLEQLERLRLQLKIPQTIQLLLSERVSEPITFRWLRPVILMPISAVNGLSIAQIEVLLLHELAHIRRYDYLINLFQSVIEILLFYHPAVWWISRKIREEREHCCDDLVLRIQNQPLLYAETLLQIQKNHFSFKTNLAMSAKGNKGQLTTRIQRLFGQYPTANTFTKGTLIALVFISTLSIFAFCLPQGQVESQLIEPILQDTTPTKMLVIRTQDNNAKEFKILVNQDIDGDADIDKILEENNIDLKIEDISTINVLGLEDANKTKESTFEKRKEDLEFLFDDEIVKLVEVRENVNSIDGSSTVDTIISFELKEKEIKNGRIEFGENETESRVEGFRFLKSPSDTSEVPTQKTIRLYGKAKAKEGDRVEEKIEPLIVLDGEIITIGLNDIDPNNIETINVYKDAKSIEKYGEKGINGVVEIWTKGAKTKKKVKVKKEEKSSKKRIEKTVAKENKLDLRSASIRKQFTISPNPVQDVLHVQATLEEKNHVKVEVFDLKGASIKVLSDATLSGSFSMDWDVSDEIAGTYIVKIIAGQEQFSEKVIISE